MAAEYVALSEPVILTTHAGRARIVFNRPEVRNALNPEILGVVATYLDEVSRDDSVRYVTFEGKDDHFASGGDIAAYAAMLELPAHDRRRTFERRVRSNFELVLKLVSLPKPVVSLVRGAVAGAGLLFVLASDFVIAEEEAFLLFAQSRIGLPLDLGVSYLLPRIVGQKAARKLAVTGARVDARSAESWGIVDVITTTDAIQLELEKLVKSLAAVAPRAVWRSKSLVLASEFTSLAAHLEAEVEAVGCSVMEPDFAEGVRAFLEKRHPLFTAAATSGQDEL